MLNIDTNTMTIALTRGDTASIVFSAVDGSGTTVTPSTGDKLKFAVAKKWGAEPIFEIETEKTALNTDDDFWTIVIGGNNEWYQKDADGQVILEGDKKIDLFKFADYVWDVEYIANSGAVDTIIGKTDDISPTFRVLGEAATE